MLKAAATETSPYFEDPLGVYTARNPSAGAFETLACHMQALPDGDIRVTSEWRHYFEDGTTTRGRTVQRQPPSVLVFSGFAVRH